MPSLTAFDPSLMGGGGSPQLLVMSATGDSIASGGDHVAFSSVIAGQHGFSGAVAGSTWTHPVGGVYVLTYEHEWDTYEGGGTIQLELDGAVPPEGLIVSGAAGSQAFGVIAYAAEAGDVGRIKVTQTSGSAQTCSAKVSVALPDPTGDTEAQLSTVTLFIDGVQVGTVSGVIDPSWTSSTVFAGQLDASASGSQFYFDDVDVVAGSSLVSNTGFESALLSAAQDSSVQTGNWKPYRQISPNPAVTTSPVYAGTYALNVDAPGGSQANRYVFQDISLPSGSSFDLVGRVRPVSGSQYLRVSFDWNRNDNGMDDAAKVTMSSTETLFEAFGLVGPSCPALPTGQWSHVLLQVAVGS